MNKNEQPPYWIYAKCTGPNPNCRLAHRHGRSVHLIPNNKTDQPALVLDTYHYVTYAEAIQEFNDAMRDAPIIRTDAELYEARRLHKNYKLPVSWVDPTLRNAADWAKYSSGFFSKSLTVPGGEGRIAL